MKQDRVVGNGHELYQLSSDIAGEDISEWDYKGLVESLASQELQPQHEVHLILHHRGHYLSCQISPSLSIFLERFIISHAYVLQSHFIWSHVRVVLLLPNEGIHQILLRVDPRGFQISIANNSCPCKALLEEMHQ